MPRPSWCTGRGGPAAFLLFCALCQALPPVWAGTWNPLPLGAEHQASLSLWVQGLFVLSVPVLPRVGSSRTDP